MCQHPIISTGLDYRVCVAVEKEKNYSVLGPYTVKYIYEVVISVCFSEEKSCFVTLEQVFTERKWFTVVLKGPQIF